MVEPLVIDLTQVPIQYMWGSVALVVGLLFGFLFARFVYKVKLQAYREASADSVAAIAQGIRVTITDRYEEEDEEGHE